MKKKGKVMVTTHLADRMVTLRVSCPDDISAGKWLAILEQWIDLLAAKDPKEAQIFYPPQEEKTNG